MKNKTKKNSIINNSFLTKIYSSKKRNYDSKNSHGLFKKLFFSFLIYNTKGENYLNKFSEYDTNYANKIILFNDTNFVISGSSSLNTFDLEPTLYHTHHGNINFVNTFKNDDYSNIYCNQNDKYFNLKKDLGFNKFNKISYISDILYEGKNKNHYILTNSFSENHSYFSINYYNKDQTKSWNNKYYIYNQYLISSSFIKKKNSDEIIIAGSKYNCKTNDEDFYILNINLETKKSLENKNFNLYFKNYKTVLKRLVDIDNGFYYIGQLKSDHDNKLLIGAFDNNFTPLWSKYSLKNIKINSVFVLDNSILACGEWMNLNTKEIIFFEYNIKNSNISFSTIHNSGTCYSIFKKRDNIYLGISFEYLSNKFSQPALIKIQNELQEANGTIFYDQEYKGKISAINFLESSNDLFFAGNIEHGIKSKLLIGKINLDNYQNEDDDCTLIEFKPIIKKINTSLNFLDIELSIKPLLIFEKSKKYITLGSYMPKQSNNLKCMINETKYLTTYKNKKINTIVHRFFNWVTLTTMSIFLCLIISILYLIKRKKNNQEAILAAKHFQMLTQDMDPFNNKEDSRSSLTFTDTKEPEINNSRLKIKIANTPMQKIRMSIINIITPNKSSINEIEEYPEILTNIRNKKDLYSEKKTINVVTSKLLTLKNSLSTRPPVIGKEKILSRKIRSQSFSYGISDPTPIGREINYNEQSTSQLFDIDYEFSVKDTQYFSENDSQNKENVPINEDYLEYGDDRDINFNK
ncbi:MAG: hypothetical protein GY830_10040 [Bacteroidetes bacterium]|nr:hypothetical protein [Bacteroidota bacterium]